MSDFTSLVGDKQKRHVNTGSFIAAICGLPFQHGSGALHNQAKRKEILNFLYDYHVRFYLADDKQKRHQGKSLKPHTFAWSCPYHLWDNQATA